MHSVIGIRSKRIKTKVISVKKDPLISVLSNLVHSSRSDYSKKRFKKKDSILPTYSYFFSGCNLNHTNFLIWPNHFSL